MESRYDQIGSLAGYYNLNNVSLSKFKEVQKVLKYTSFASMMNKQDLSPNHQTDSSNQEPVQMQDKHQ